MSLESLQISGENTKALEQIGKELGEMQTKKADAVVNLCDEYQLIKPILDKALPLIRLIPKFGKQIADAIQLLMGIADQFCPTT